MCPCPGIAVGAILYQEGRSHASNMSRSGNKPNLSLLLSVFRNGCQVSPPRRGHSYFPKMSIKDRPCSRGQEDFVETAKCFATFTR